MDQKLYKALCNEPTEKIDEAYHVIINNPSALPKSKKDAVIRRWHELHDDDIRGV